MVLNSMTATREGTFKVHLVLEVELAGGNQWYHRVPAGGWEKPTAHGLLGCAFDLTVFCMEKLTPHSGSIKKLH